MTGLNEHTAQRMGQESEKEERKVNRVKREVPCTSSRPDGKKPVGVEAHVPYMYMYMYMGLEQKPSDMKNFWEITH